MEPKIQIGDVVVAKKIKDEELKAGDIICFRQGHSVITHRISAVIESDTGTEYKTKGDNNNAEDSGTITEAVIEGKVIKIVPYLGNISLLLQQRSVIILIIGVFYIYLLFNNKIKKRKEERSRKRKRYERTK